MARPAAADPSGPQQLSLDFEASIGERHKRARAAQLKQLSQDTLPFVPVIDVDVHLVGGNEAIVDVAGKTPETSIAWLHQITGAITYLRKKRVGIPVDRLDRLLYVRPPAKVTLDASAGAVARAIWAHKLGLKPLVVRRWRGRLLANSSGWPKGLAVEDAPWTAISVIESMGLDLRVEESARGLLLKKLAESKRAVATGGLAGSAVLLKTDRPELLEAMELPALSYAGPRGSGTYKMPLLVAECLLAEPTITLTKELTAAIKKASAPAKPLVTSPGFAWDLYKFQARDAGRARRILETAGGVLLAGSMGSGKTTVALSLIYEMDLWPVLIVAPLAAFSTWVRQLGELDKRVVVAKGSLATSWEELSSGDYDAALVSYDRLHSFVELLEQCGFRAIVADEVQRIRTPSSRRSRSLRALSSSVPNRIGLSGTPLQNRLTDLLPLGSFLVPGEWRPRGTRDLEEIYPGDDPVAAVAQHLSTLMVRRKMEDTGVRLPGKHVHRVYVPLSPEQRRALEDLEQDAREAKEAGEFTNENRMHVFSRLQKMRQIISCPSEAGVGGQNPKIASGLELIEEYKDQGRKGVVFCVYRQTWIEIGQALDKVGIKHTGIWGASSIEDRIAAEHNFHADPDIDVFVGTLASCSEALTLSPTATYVILCDMSYDPASLAQAEARAYRMNTVEPVDVVYLHASAPGGTLDDRILELLNIKKELFARVVDGEETWQDDANVHRSLEDLVFLVTGQRDEVPPSRDHVLRGVDVDHEVEDPSDLAASTQAFDEDPEVANEGAWDDENDPTEQTTEP